MTSTVLDKVICLYFYNCYITTETLLQQIISSRPTLLQYGSKRLVFTINYYSIFFSCGRGYKLNQKTVAIVNPW